MKKIFAFSLAEALITLLIVCLITLASIPVLTKKKRDAKTNGSHGTWICARHSLGHLVHWSTNDGSKDINNPDEWLAGCTFVPPLNISSFNITAIGAGGNGADGISEMELVADSNSQGSFSPQEDGLYRVVVVGAGGGGGDARNRESSYCESNKCGSGGAGASGAYIIVDLELLKNQNYTLSPGVGGAKRGCAHGDCSRPERKRGETGGISEFYSTRDYGAPIYIWADGGEGGQRIVTAGSGWCSDNCGGGNGGRNENTTYGYKLNNVLQSSDKYVAHSKGDSGESGGCGKIKTAQGGAGLNATEFHIPFSGLGKGGNGGQAKRNYNGCSDAKNGANGRILVYKIKRFQGNGGQAAQPDEKMVLYVKGKMNVEVGKAVKPTDSEVLDENGILDTTLYRTLRTSKVEIYDSLGRVTKRIVGYPGEDGETYEGEYPTNGEHSYWTQDGGGKAAQTTCEESGKIAIYSENEYDTYKTFCKQTICRIDATRLPTGYNVGIATNNKELAGEVNPINYTTNITTISSHIDSIGKSYFEAFFPLTNATGAVVGIDYQKIKNNFNQYFPILQNNESCELASFANFDTEETINGTTYKNLKDNNRCFTDNTLTYLAVCTEEKEENTSNKYRVPIGYIKNYVCYDGSNAETGAYGAGGGGGYAFTEPSFSSKGGYGASGAVIIEW